MKYYFHTTYCDKIQNGNVPSSQNKTDKTMPHIGTCHTLTLGTVISHLDYANAILVSIPEVLIPNYSAC